ncbi:Leptomycin B resistance protein pmd1 [Neonectria ditissima]|uniref:Leptomycin B resistance protein pmd1 n=1 Tax=Neonectria ditissima TaxID=78410 RepID=A0A0P7B1K2_9HYPO|nr:Leptomycin B resistance protein pmd1 [Neonectria ditissima]
MKQESIHGKRPEMAEDGDGDAILTPPSTVAPSGESSGNGFFRVFTYNDTVGWISTSIALVCMVASGVLLPLMNLVFGKFVTVFNDFNTGAKTPEEFRKDINHFTLYFVYLFVAKLGLTISSINAIRVTRSLRIDFLKQTLRQEIGYFDSSEPGSVSTSLNTGGNLVNQGISEKFGVAVQAASTFFASFVVAFVVQWKLTLITLCIVPFMLIVITICVMLDSKIENKLLSTWGEADKLAEEVFASIRNAHAFWAYSKLSRKFEDIVDRARVLGKKKPPIWAVLFCIQFFCIYAGYGLAFWQGIRMYHGGEIAEPGDVVTVILAVVLAAQGLTQIAPQIMVISKAMASAEEIFKTIDRKSKIDSLSAEGSEPSECHGDIVFENVGFAYPSRPNVRVLKNLDLVIPANKTTAIVGMSGSGKSTVVGLLERWFSPLSGTITLDGQSIDRLNIQWLRTNIRLVQQEPVLFSGTVFENVAYGLAGTPQAELPDDEKYKLVEEACKAAYAYEFIEKLPKGFETQIGQRGAMLSGGQKQRLAIARSVVSNPRVLLLDEATSALDANSERIVQQALNNAALNRTTLVIAHRLSTIRHADNIVVMSKGKILEQGTHTDLMELDGAYSHLVQAQDLGKETKHGQEADQESSEEAGVEVMKPTDATAIVQQESEAQTHKSDTVNYNLLWSLIIIIREQKTLWIPFGTVAVAASLAGGSNPALAVLFSRILDTFTLTGDDMVNRGSFYALMFFVMALANLVVYMVLGWMSTIISQQIMNFYRHDIFNNILRQEMTFFDDPDNTTGALVSRLATEPTALQDLLSSNISLILTILVNLISSCILAIAYGWKLGLVLTLGALPPLVASGYVRLRLEFKLDNAAASRFANSAGIASEAIMSIRTVASLVLEHQILAQYEDSLRTIARTSVTSLMSSMLWYSLSQSMSFLAMALGFWYGGRLISFGEYTTQQFYTVFIAVIFAGEAAAALFMFTSSITQATGAANYVFNLRKQVPEDMKDAQLPESDSAHSRDQAAVAMDIKDLKFAYPRRPAAQVLRGVNLTIQPGQFIAFVGPSGCGKTTVLSLIERFYEPTSGAIFLNGVDTRSVRLGQHRRHMALVQQEPVLYQGSLRENISLGLDDSSYAVTDEVILDACRQANIDTFIMSLPDGLATPCGPQGTQFSGGQRQRIAIARALLRNPRLLLLDEATSSLDTESERVVQAALDAAAKGEGSCGRKRTTIAVAHRLSTIKDADVIVVFSQGRIVEAGDHEELLEKRGIYYGMCFGQSLEQ